MLSRPDIEKILNDCFSYLLKKGKDHMSKRILKKVVAKNYQKIFDSVFETQEKLTEESEDKENVKPRMNGKFAQSFPDSLEMRSTGGAVSNTQYVTMAKGEESNF